MPTSRTQYTTSSSTKKKTGIGTFPVANAAAAATRSTIAARPDAPRTGPAPRGTPQPTTTARDRTYSAPPPANQGPPNSVVAQYPQTEPGSPASYNATYTGNSNFGNTGASGGSLTTPLTGFAGAFDPQAIQSLLANPDPLIQQVMLNQGVNPAVGGAGMFSLAQPYADALNAIMPLAWGGGFPGTPSAPLNWMGKMINQGMTPGGAAIDFQDVMRAIQGLTPMGTAPGSVPGLYEGVFTGAPQDQVNAVKQMAYGAAQAGLPPAFQRAMQNAMNIAAVNYMTNQYSANPTQGASFQQYIPNFYGR